MLPRQKGGAGLVAQKIIRRFESFPHRTNEEPKGRDGPTMSRSRNRNTLLELSIPPKTPHDAKDQTLAFYNSALNINREERRAADSQVIAFSLSLARIATQPNRAKGSGNFSRLPEPLAFFGNPIRHYARFFSVNRRGRAE